LSASDDEDEHEGRGGPDPSRHGSVTASPGRALRARQREIVRRWMVWWKTRLGRHARLQSKLSRQFACTTPAVFTCLHRAEGTRFPSPRAW